MMKRFLILMLILPSILVAWGANCLFVVAQTGLPYTYQSWFYCGLGNAADTDKVKEKWKEDMHITSVAYTSRGWFFVMSKGSGLTYQSYKISKDWPEEYIKKEKDNGCFITAFSYGVGGWFVVMSKGSGIKFQGVKVGDTNKVTQYLRLDNEYAGFEATVIQSYYNGWLVCNAKGSSAYHTQDIGVVNSYDALSSFIRKNWDRNYYLTALSQAADGEIICVMSKGESGIGQSYTYNQPDNIKQWIQDQWNDGKNIAFVAGGFDRSTVR